MWTEIHNLTKKIHPRGHQDILSYAQAINSTMLTALSAIAMVQAKPTTKTLENKKQFLDYAATKSEAMVTYHVSDMVLRVHSDASYLREPRACS